MPNPRIQLAMAAQDSLVYLIGGNNGAAFLNTVDIYNVNTEEWSSTEIPTARAFPTAVSANGKILVAGGNIWSPAQNFDVVDIYDPTTQEWSLDHLSLARSFIHAATANGKVLFAGGGIWDFGGITFVDRVDIFDLNTEEWSVAQLSEPRFGMGVAVVNNKIFFAGGFIAPGMASKRIDIYDAETGNWSLDSLSAPRAYLAGAAVGDLALFAGGAGGNGNVGTDLVDIYNTTTQEWTQASLGLPRAGLIGVTAYNKVYFINGGEEDLDQFIYLNAYNIVDVYDHSNNSWDLTSTEQSRINHAAIGLNNKLYVAGGYDFVGAIDELEIFCPEPVSATSKVLNHSQIMIYPNPASDILILNLEEKTANHIQNVQIFSSRGQVLLEESFHGAHRATININGLSAGVYFMKIYSEEGIYTKKVVKQ